MRCVPLYPCSQAPSLTHVLGALQLSPAPLSLCWDHNQFVPRPGEAFWSGVPAIVCAAQATHTAVLTAGLRGGQGSAALSYTPVGIVQKHQQKHTKTHTHGGARYGLVLLGLCLDL